MIELFYDDITIKEKKLLNSGTIKCNDSGLVIIKGKNGSGKTLLFQNIFSNKKNSCYNIIMLNQNNDAVISSQSIIKNISMTENIEKNNYITKCLKELELDYILKLKSSKMSGGEKRLVAILRAYFSDSNIVLLDEPSNDLDFCMVNKVISLIKNMSKNRLVLLITHDDRFYNLTENCLTISNNRLDTNYIASDNRLIYKQGYKKDIKFFNHCFKFNIVSLLLLFLMLLITSFECISYKINEKSKVLDDTRESQIELYKPVSRSMGLKLFTEIYPYDLVDTILDKNIFQDIKILKDFNKYHSEKKSVYNLDKIKSSSQYEIYPYEYFDKINRKTYFVLDYYLNKYFDTDWQSSDINTTLLFDKPYKLSDNDSLYDIDENKLKICINELNNMVIDGKKLEVVCLIIVFKNKIDYNLLKENLSNLDMSNTYIRSNDIKDYIYDIRKLDCLINGTRNISMFFLLMIFKYYSYNEENIIENISKKYNNRLHKLGLYFIFVVFNIIYFRNWEYSIVNYYYSILLFFLIPIHYYLDNIVIKRMINKYYRWWYR